MLYRIYFIMMTAFLNGRYIYKNIKQTTSKDDVIIMRYIQCIYYLIIMTSFDVVGFIFLYIDLFSMIYNTHIYMLYIHVYSQSMRDPSYHKIYGS